MRGLGGLAWIVAWAALSSGGMAGAQEDLGQDEQARALFEAGRVAFENGRYDDALAHFLESYELSERPELLFNIGYASQLLGREEQALDAYRRYLEAVPDAPNRAAIEARIALLQGGDSEAAEGPRGTAVGGWVVAGAGAAAAIVGGVLLALAASAASDVTGASAGTPWVDVEGPYNRSGTLSIAGAVLLGVGGAAAAVGLVWALAGRPGSNEPAVAVGLAPGGVRVRGAF